MSFNFPFVQWTCCQYSGKNPRASVVGEKVGGSIVVPVLSCLMTSPLLEFTCTDVRRLDIIGLARQLRSKTLSTRFYVVLRQEQDLWKRGRPTHNHLLRLGLGRFWAFRNHRKLSRAESSSFRKKKINLVVDAAASGSRLSKPK